MAKNKVARFYGPRCMLWQKTASHLSNLWPVFQPHINLPLTLMED